MRFLLISLIVHAADPATGWSAGPLLDDATSAPSPATPVTVAG